MPNNEKTSLEQAIEEINNTFDQQHLLTLATKKYQGIKELVRKTKEQTALEYYLVGRCANRCHYLCGNNPEKFGSWDKVHKPNYLDILGKSHGYLSSVMNFARWTGITKYADLGPSVLMAAARAMNQYLFLETLYNPEANIPKHDVQAFYDKCEGKVIANTVKKFLRAISQKPSLLYIKTLAKVAKGKGEKYQSEFKEDSSLNITGRQATDLVNALRGEHINKEAVDSILHDIKQKSGGRTRKPTEKDTEELVKILSEQKQEIQKLLTGKGVDTEAISVILKSFDYSISAVGSYYVRISGVPEVQLS